MTLELAEKVPCVFLELMEEVVMVVFPVVGGKRTPEPSVVLGEDILAYFAKSKAKRWAGYPAKLRLPEALGGQLTGTGNRAVVICVGVELLRSAPFGRGYGLSYLMG